MKKMPKLDKILKTKLSGGLQISDIAELVRKHGRGKDSVLAHITPKEAALLKARGGRGSRNPHTGLLEFDDTPVVDLSYSAPATSGIDVQAAPVEAAPAPAMGDVSAYQYTPPTSTGDFNSTVQGWGGLGDASVLPTYTPAADSSYQGLYQAPAAAGAVDQALGDNFYKENIALQPDAAATSGSQSWLSQTGDKISTALQDPSTLLKLGLGLGAGGLGVYSKLQQDALAQKNAAAIQQAYSKLSSQEQAQAQPFMTQGALEAGLAEQGQLTAPNQQALEATRAQAAQATAGAGAPAAAQAARMVEDARQRLLSNQLKEGLTLISAGNPMITAAMNAELQSTIQPMTYQQQANANANQAMQGAFNAIAALFGSSRGA